MGLDWCLQNKPRPGMEEAFAALTNESSDDERKRVSMSPYETLGCPQVGIDERATEYFLREVVPSHREAIAAGKGHEGYRRFWLQPDADLVKARHGSYIVELAEYSLSTVQTATPFLSLAGYFSFRGKAIGYSPLLPKSLQDEAYEHMDPPAMAGYAGRIEAAALASLRAEHSGATFAPVFQSAAEAREWAEPLQAEYEALHPDAWTRPEPTGITASAVYLLIVLDAARWLRFWADLGHSMWAWY